MFFFFFFLFCVLTLVSHCFSLLSIKEPEIQIPIRWLFWGTSLPSEKEMPTHSSVLAWWNPRDGGAWWASIYGVTQSRTQLKRLGSSSSSSSLPSSPSAGSQSKVSALPQYLISRIHWLVMWWVAQAWTWYLSVLPALLQGLNLPDPGIEPISCSSCTEGGYFTTEPWGKPLKNFNDYNISKINWIMWMNNNACVLSHFSHVRLFVGLWTVACQAPLSMGFSRQEY